ncbi:MAG: amino acid adenylation domain-containing protein [Burkholderiaceae bacterium]
MSASTRNRQPKGVEPRDPRPLSAWLQRAAQSHGSHIALEAADLHYTYAQLGAEVESLAHKLTQAGVAPGDRVAIAADRDAQTIIAILAVVHAGAAYVPLDLAYPPERLRAMLETAQPSLVLGSPQALATLKTLAGDYPTLEAPAKYAQAPHAAKPGLMYVLFTSGSTGTPKGVAMGDLPLRHLIEWHATHRNLCTAARTLQFAPLSFDVHFQEIFSTIACAGTLVLIPEHHRRDPALLVKALVEQRVERIFLPYIALQMIADAAHDTQLVLQDVISAGEQLQVTPSIRQLFQRHPGMRLHNHYGPTESHVVTAFELEGDAAAWPEIPPIGQALPHVKVQLLDEAGAIDPQATVGELLLGGETLAFGYLGKPDLSQERFQSIARHAGLWYTTGDLVRAAPDGVLTYLGRADQQLKVDGFRIEPGEIELVIMAHPSVKDAVVTAPDVPGSGKQLVAHVVLKDAAADVKQLGALLRAHLRNRLPDYMIPVRFIKLERLPTTPSGKIDRRALPLPTVADANPHRSPLELVRMAWQDLLGLETIDDEQNLFDIGARSLLVMRFIAKLQSSGVQTVSVADVYDRPTVAGIAGKISGNPAASSNLSARGKTHQTSSAIAIVGMATRTAGASNVDEFWQNLLDGKEGIRHFSPNELDPSIPEAIRSRPNFVAARGVVENAGRFDASFFGISTREAVLLDPQQRMLLELAWNALEHAGIDPSRGNARVGVYAGTANNSYAPAMRTEAPEIIQQAGEFATMLASEKDYVATRIANRLNLNGPAVSVHTACSTGLVAVTQAWQALAAGQCDLALAGGATVIVPQEGGYLHVEGAMESADGHCRPFDAAASGTVFASGGAVVALKRLEDAQRDGDTLYAVIRGVGINNDGGEKASFTAPSVRGQAAAIRMALDHAGIDARSIGYVEAHGTGTALGDPIEIAALTQAWQMDTQDRQYCAIGSLKSNLGHTIAAAGVLGLIKAALCVHHGVVPRTLHFQKPNPQINFAQTPFKVVAANTAWVENSGPRRAAISSFGVGGTNAHVVIEQAADRHSAHAAQTNPAPVLLPLSAKTNEALTLRMQQLADYLEQHPTVDLKSVSATLMHGRVAMPQRAAVAARAVPSAVAALRSAPKAKTANNKLRLVYLFPGQGSQHPGMAGSLYTESAAFREAFDACFQYMTPLLGADLRPWLIDASVNDAEIAAQLAQTKFAQPALFAMHYALTAWLDTLGLQPDAMIGHSIGEYAAACRAGVMRLQDAATMIVARGAAMFAQPPGAMLAVKADATRVGAMLPHDVEIAGFNAPTLTVVAGPSAAIDSFYQKLESQGIESTRLKVSHAFHSAAMDGALPRVEEAAQRVQLHPPEIPVYSCVSGAPLDAADAINPSYWARQVRASVQFARAISAELAHQNVMFVEVGPSQALTALVRQHRNQQGLAPQVVPLLGPASNPGDAALAAINTIGALWSHGAAVAWPTTPDTQRVALPTYPFGGEQHWFKRRVAGTQTPAIIDTTHDTPVATTQQAPHLITNQLPMVAQMTRLPILHQELLRVFSDVSGIAIEELSTSASFTDQGLDSLSLTQATLEIERVFDIKLRFRRLLEDLDSIEKLATFFDTQLHAEKFAPPPTLQAANPAPTHSPGVPSSGVAPLAPQPLPALQLGASPDGLQQLIMQQMQLMSQQLALLSGQVSAAVPVVAVQAQVPAKATAPSSTPSSVQPIQDTSLAPEERVSQPSIKALVEKPFGASARITLDVKQELSIQQREWLAKFIERYNARSGKSKTFSQQHRNLMADPRVVTGFNPLWKDLVYPIVADRSKGAYVWDLDGNQYIDLLSCFGANFLGYQPDDVVQAMVDQLHKGIEVGPQHPLSAEVAQLISEFTGMERVAFCNTGSEAVMGAMRIARTVTGRKTIAIFTNSYHGIFDEVIVRGTKQLRSLSAAPGILANAVENILVLDWASEDSLKILRERGKELAAIMTEPIQNKYPTVQPREFLKSLRSIADNAGCALIFDEVVTGFRVAPGGAQEFYGVRADISTYGKIIGGGLPFAAIGGSGKWLDALDGGTWQYGDDSYPEAGVTYFAGTFVRHPLALAAARASLLHLKAGGQALYHAINARTQSLIERLNAAFAVRSAPVKAVHCASLWRLSWDDDQKFVSLFYYLARHHGLHLYEQFGHFVTEAMGETELDKIFSVFTQALDELMALGFITPRPGATPPGGYDANSPPSAPLTPGQTERWLAANFDSNARKALNESICLSLKGEVDTTALVKALEDVLRRHDAFRVTFDLEEPLQRLSPELSAPNVELVDFSDAADPIAAFHQYCDAHNSHEFALDKAPLARLAILRVASNHVFVHVVVSHLIFDGWATPIFLNDLASAYRARLHGAAPSWTPAESALTFGAREQERWESTEAQSSRAYWCELLKNPPAPLQLGDKEPPTPRLYAGSTIHYTFDQPVAAALRKIAADNKATLFQTLFASVALAVQKRTARNDFVISVPFASQSLERHDALIADGVLDLPVRIQLQDSASFSDVLAQTRTRLMDALEHPLATQGSIARALGIPAAGNRPPLTNVYFNLNPRLSAADFEPLVSEFQEGRKLGLLSEVVFNFYDAPGSLTLDLHHSTEFFSPEAAAHLLASVNQVIAAITNVQSAAYAIQPAKAGVLSAVNRQHNGQLPRADLERLHRWNDTTVPYESGLRLGDLIRRSVVGQPDAIAVRFEGRSVTYADLDRMAWSLAHQLREKGIEPGAYIGVCLDRSIELVVALVGIVYAGAAYVPLDPDYPPQRIAHMCEDADIKLLVSRREELARIQKIDLSSIDTVFLDAELLSFPAQSGKIIGTENDPAYVIFTSGSTGRPKGAINTHQGVVNWLLWMQQTYKLTGEDRVLQKTPYSFDVSVREFFWPLVTGASIVVARPGGHREPDYLVSLIEQARITVIHFVPSMLQVFLEEPDLRRCSSLRLTICSGEALPTSTVNAFLSQLHKTRLVNLYGPTEAAVEVTHWDCIANDPRPVAPIGFPVANTRMYVLNEDLQLQPVGAEGDLYIGGVQVGLGYVGRPELTAERFITDPFVPNGRMYKSGDIARWLDNGALEYLGRSDHQVKIRGFRIELGEIEASLLEYPSIARSVVVAKDFGNGDMRLIAYLVASNVAASEANLKRHLLTKLPAHMVPTYFVFMESIPLLHNGKIDRNSLPPPNFEQTAKGPASSPRAIDYLDIVSASMARVLGVDKLQPDDNFFEKGGHSLTAAKLLAQLSKQTGKRLALRTVFEAPSPRKLAQAFHSLQQDIPASKIPARNDQTSAPLSLMQQRMLFLEHLTPGSAQHNVPSGHRLLGALNLDAFKRALSSLIERHSTLRTIIDASLDPPVQRVRSVEGTPLSLQIVSVNAKNEQDAITQISQMIVDETQIPFAIEQGPLFRCKLFKISEHDHVFFLLVHHMIWDGWSYDIFYKDFSAAYSAFESGRTPAFDPLPITYGDFSSWSRAQEQSEETKKQIAAWVAELSPIPEAMNLPADKPRPAVMSGKGASHIIKLDHSFKDKLHTIASRNETTPFVILLASYALMLHKASSQTDFVVATPVRGRETPELEKIIGFFVNALPLRFQVDTSKTGSEWIHHVHRIVSKAFASPDVPFEQIVRALDIPRDESRPLLAQTTFSYQDVRERPTSWGSVQHERFLFPLAGSTHDLTLWSVETDTCIECVFSYNSDIFLPSTVSTFASLFQTIAEQLVSESNQQVRKFTCLSEHDRESLARWNHTKQDYPKTTIPSVLAAIFTKHKKDAAIECEGAQTTYLELDMQSNQLARALRAKGVGRGSLVGLCVNRSEQMLVALLAVLKAGAAYVPLDPSYPAERLNYMALDSNLTLLVTESACMGCIDWPRDKTLVLDLDTHQIAEQDSRSLEPSAALDATPEDPAYVIYTSGSTGRPKGVIVPHRAVVNFLTSMQSIPGLHKIDRLLAITTLSFDIAVLELLLPLSVGACVILASRDQAADANALRALLETSSATVLQATPSTWRMLLESGWAGNQQLTALIGGEALPEDLAKSLTPKVKALWNMYGPTETTVWSTCSQIARDTAEISIGKPIANTTVHIVSEDGALCPVGIPGEICIGGDGVTLGYLNRPELTSERFVPDPLSPGNTMYRTGDRGRWKHNGQLEHMGRLDFQVKLRGHRIELGEIENALQALPQVQRSVVIVREDQPGDQRLIAYVVPKASEQLNHNLLIEALRARLPDYMLPQSIVELTAIPLLPNGKIDRKALPAPKQVAVHHIPAHLVPSTHTERTIALVWQQVLGIEAVSLTDNFFNLGGHSLLAMRVVYQVTERLGAKIPVRQLIFETLQQIATSIDAQNIALKAGDITQENPPASKAGNNVSKPSVLPNQKLGWLKRMSNHLGLGR